MSKIKYNMHYYVSEVQKEFYLKIIDVNITNQILINKARSPPSFRWG